MPIPLTNARTTSVGKDNSTSALEGIDETVTSNGGSDLLGSWGDGELALEVEAVVRSLLDNGSRASHVLIGRVSARTDETNFKFIGPAILLDLGGELGKGGGQIRSERTVDVGLEFRKVLKKHQDNSGDISSSNSQSRCVDRTQRPHQPLSCGRRTWRSWRYPNVWWH